MRLKKDFIIHSTGEEEILLAVNEEAKRFHGIVKLNPTASEIVHLLEKDISLEEIVTAFKEKYSDVEESTLKEDIESIINQLKEINAIED